jgi:hypothetical protein
MLYALCDRSSRLARPPGCARIDSRLDTAKIGSDGRVEAHRARLRAVLGRKKTFPHGLGQSLHVPLPPSRMRSPLWYKKPT